LINALRAHELAPLKPSSLRAFKASDFAGHEAPGRQTREEALHIATPEERGVVVESLSSRDMTAVAAGAPGKSCDEVCREQVG